MLNGKYLKVDIYCAADTLSPLVSIPVRFFNSVRGDICTVLGLRYVVPPDYDESTQRLGQLTEGDEGLAFYEIITLTSDEVKDKQADALNIQTEDAVQSIKFLRQEALDKLVKSPGVSVVYDRNIRAVGLWEKGLFDEVLFVSPDLIEVTVLAYLTALAVADKRTVSGFCLYVRAEEGLAVGLGRRIEEGYLSHKHRAFASLDPLVVLAEYEALLASLV